MYVAMAMAATSMLSAHSQKKKALQAAVDDAKIQRAKLQRARANAATDLATNAQRAREATQKREIAMEESAITGEAAIDSAFAGSGISGTSRSEIDSQLDAAVAKNKNENKSALDTQLGDMYKNYMRQNEDINDNASNIGAGAPTGGGLMEGIQAGVSGFSQGASIDSSLGISSKIDDFFKTKPTGSNGVIEQGNIRSPYSTLSKGY